MRFVTPGVPAETVTPSSNPMGHTNQCSGEHMKIGRALSNDQPALHQSHAVSKCFHGKGKGHWGVFKAKPNAEDCVLKKLLPLKKM